MKNTISIAVAVALLGCGDAASSPTDAGGARDADAATVFLDGSYPLPDAGSIRVDRFVTDVVDFAPGDCAGYGIAQMPKVVQGPPVGFGAMQGSTHVVSLGRGGSIVLGFGKNAIVDAPGPDFVVFENAFETGPYDSFSEPAVVGLSRRGTAPADFEDFPCDLSATKGAPEQGRWPYPGCAGVHPVLADVTQNCLPPTDPTQAGGDAFDLATLGWDSARWLRLRDAGLARSGTTTKGFDLDAVVLIHYRHRVAQ